MKKFLKNAIISILTICFILNIVNLINMIINYYTFGTLVSIEAQEISQKGFSNEEEILQTLATFYYSGFGNKIQIQIGILGFSLIFGIIIGTIITFEKKSKLKVICSYILGLLLSSVVLTLPELSKESNFFGEIFYNIELIWKGYTLIFVFLYAVRFYISNEKTKKLNEILRVKQGK